MGYIKWQQITDPSPLRTVAMIHVIQPVLPPAQPFYKPDYTPPPAVNGMAPVISKIPTKQPVVFLTIDDGLFREPLAALNMQRAGVSATLFLVQDYTVPYANYFNSLAKQTGSAIEDHTVDHQDLVTLSLEGQKREICTSADVDTQAFGRRPTLFRPPYGSFNTDTERAVASCGMRAVVLWHATANGGLMHYQDGNQLVAGDIVLMHFRPTFLQDLGAFIAAAKASGLHPQLLEKWLSN